LEIEVQFFTFNFLIFFSLYEERAQSSQCVPRKQESKGLSEVLTMPTSVDGF
jgi:hypothetical protein